MYFLDNSAHIFKLPDYNKKPIGYEYDEQDYIFWFNDEKDNTRLSVNNYYGKIINVLFEVSNIKNLENTQISSIYDIEITCDSENFKLVPASQIQENLRNNESILDNVDIDTQHKTLNSDDILVIKVTQEGVNYIMIPIYIIGTSKYSGTWLTNILIHISNKFNNKHTYCPITIGGIFNDEYESLVIHGKNMGISLPKEILKAVNGTSIYNDIFDEELYNKKIKEYLLNYMDIKGELGNYNSAIKSLKWFGYQDNIELYKLLETDNQFQLQYVRDYFDIQQDIIKAYNNFLNSQFVGLKYKLNTETGELERQDINKDFWGEGLPILTDNNGKYKMVNTDEYLDESYDEGNQQFKYSASYINYTIYELMFKLSYLKYYYQTYFLPIFIILKNMHIEYKVYATPNKYLTYTSEHYFEQIINVQEQDSEVLFTSENIRYFTHQNHYVDENFNEYVKLIETDEEQNYEVIKDNDKYEINDTCLYIPIKFKNYKYYNCILVLKDNDMDQILYTSKFSFINKKDNEYYGFIFYPKLINELSDINLYTYINKNYTLYLNVNNRWYEYKFISKIHELDVHIGTLEYNYWINDVNYFYELYHEQDIKNENGEIYNPSEVIFRFEQEDVELNITNYIKDKDFFDQPTKYFSNFTQINTINGDNVEFNIWMNDPDFIYSNDTNFGLYEKLLKNQSQEYINKSIEDLVNKYQSTVNLISNYKYLNNVHLYYIYEQSTKPGFDILRYKNDLAVLCDQVYIERFFDTDDDKFKFKFTNVSGYKITNEDEYINQYMLENPIGEDKIPLEERQAYYFILERNQSYQLTGNNADGLYTYYDDINNVHQIGWIMCPIINHQIEIDEEKLHNGQYSFGINNEYNISNISIVNDYIYYNDTEYRYTLRYTFEPYVKIVSHIDDTHTVSNYKPYNHDEYQIGQELFGKLKLFYYEKVKILNVFGYYNEKFCTDLNESELTCTVNLEGVEPINNVKLYPASPYVEYSDIRYANHQLINHFNPSCYWISCIDGSSLDFNNLEESFMDLGMNHSLEELENEDPKFINYLYQDLTGLSGTYKIDADNNYIKLVVEIDGEEITEDTFELTGNEEQVFVTFRYNPDNLPYQESIIFEPHIYSVVNTEDQEVLYDESQNLADWYRQFFYKKYSISVTNSDYVKEIWDSYIQLDDNNNYDTYLMHGKDYEDDPEYWYFMFISKNTCDDPNILNNMNKYPDKIKFDKYILKHISTKQLFLINRMRVNYAKNIYHFNTSDMIVCSLYNNKMLPHNMNITSKWVLTPLSYGANSNNIIYANTNTAIISVKNANAYDKGYYNIQVNYSLDSNTINYQTINKKILIK